VSKLFGIPVGALAVVLLVALAAALGALAVLALRNRVLLRLGVRNVGRRRGRSALIVAGLMLGTTIITAALVTGDTMSHTIRSTATRALGRTDVAIAAAGAKVELNASDSGSATGTKYFPQRSYDRIAATLARSSLADAAIPAIVEPVGVLDATSRRTEPQTTLFASDPARMRGFATIRTDHGRAVTLSELRSGEVFINTKSAEQLDARAGDVVRVFAGGSLLTARVRAIVRYDGAGSAKSTLMLPLAAAQQLLGKPGLIKEVMIANRGGDVALSNQVLQRLRPTLGSLGLEARSVKKEALDEADKGGAAFMPFFTSFGSFSIAAGILLIFLIFVMLSAERRTELGIARAVGTRRSQLVEMFVFEGVAYDLIAAAVGALLGVAVGYGMVLLMASAFGATSDLQIGFAVKPASIVVAYAVGVLLTLAVVAFSARRVSRMNIVTAIRDLPEPQAREGRRRSSALAIAGVVLGAVLAVSGASAKEEVPFDLGVGVIVLSLVPLARNAGVPVGRARTVAGLTLLVWFVLPVTHWLLGETKSNFSAFIVGGLLLVTGATWVIMYKADLLLGGLSRLVGRSRRLAPVLKMSMAYPLRSLFRTGVTFAMFTLVVFTLVVGATMTDAFTNAFNDLKTFGGGFDVRATTSPSSPITDMRAALQRAPGINSRDFKVVSSQSFLPVKAGQVGTSARPQNYVARGVDSAFLEHTTYRLAGTANGYASQASVWRALRQHPGLGVVDATVVPRRSAAIFGLMPKFQLSSFYLEDKHFKPVSVEIRDPQTGAATRVTVIGVLAETAPVQMAGIITSQQTLAAVFGSRAEPAVQLFALRAGINPKAAAKRLETAFLPYGMHAQAFSKLLSDQVGASRTFDLLVEGFMGLGLIVGVAALGVISARAVVERRQQIGVLRAIGFQQRMVQLSFLIESSFVSLSSIVIGTALGLAVAYNIIHDTQQTPNWSNLSFAPPYLALAVIFAIVYAIALAATLVPARRASHVYPAEALRYE
jgi:putative ABC transport system permease protein